MYMRCLVTTIALCVVAFFSACAPTRDPVPPGVIPEPKPPTVEEEQYGHTILNSLREKYEIDYNNPALNRVEDIVARLTTAAKADKQPWHVYLLRDPDFKNAAATRGNHVFLWTGMIDETRSDAELAAILAHEIAHVISGHTEPDPNEELKRILIQVGAMAAGVAVSVAIRNPHLSGNVGDLTSALTQGAGEGIFLNPYSKELEFEADQIGLLLMAEAKYPPEAAIEFWERAARNPEFSSSIPFFSTHPPAEERLERLRKTLLLAEARFRGEALPMVSVKQSHVTADIPLEPSTGGDSFDLRNKPPAPALPISVSSLGSTAFATPLRYRVVGKKAVVRAAPKISARALGEFEHGATIVSVGKSGNWIEVERPDRGFLHEQDVLPVFEPSNDGPHP